MHFEIVTYPRASDFLEHAESWLLRNEVKNNLTLSVAARVADDESDSAHNLFGTIEVTNGIVGCFFRTPPWKLSVSDCPVEAVDKLAEIIHQRYPDLPGILGPPSSARPFAVTWSRNHGLAFRQTMRQRIYQLDRVDPVTDPPDGEARLATRNEVLLLAGWLTVFYEELGFPLPHAEESAGRAIDRGDAWFWCDPDPVSLGIYTGYTRNGVRMGTVYTPPEHRRRGYASMITATMSQMALDGGKKFCFLFADLANPTSNNIYRRIGYRPVSDIVDYIFEPQR